MRGPNYFKLVSSEQILSFLNKTHDFDPTKNSQLPSLETKWYLANTTR